MTWCLWYATASALAIIAYSRIAPRLSRHRRNR